MPSKKREKKVQGEVKSSSQHKQKDHKNTVPVHVVNNADRNSMVLNVNACQQRVIHGFPHFQKK